MTDKTIVALFKGVGQLSTHSTSSLTHSLPPTLDLKVGNMYKYHMQFKNDSETG